MSERTKREESHPGIFSSYRRFWRGAKWEVFLLPQAALLPQRKQTDTTPIRRLEARAGICAAFVATYKRSSRFFKPGVCNCSAAVYEFALVKGHSHRIKVYVGETGNLRARHAQYLTDGDHLSPLLTAALQDGCTVLRRYKYVATKQDAENIEAKWLGKYDFAWNQRLNGQKRVLSLHQQYFCFCFPSTVRIRRDTPVLHSRLQSPPKHTSQRSLSSKNLHKSLPSQFLVSA